VVRVQYLYDCMTNVWVWNQKGSLVLRRPCKQYSCRRRHWWRKTDCSAPDILSVCSSCFIHYTRIYGVCLKEYWVYSVLKYKAYRTVAFVYTYRCIYILLYVICVWVHPVYNTVYSGNIKMCSSRWQQCIVYLPPRSFWLDISPLKAIRIKKEEK
jgi:hypothetical protein